MKLKGSRFLAVFLAVVLTVTALPMTILRVSSNDGDQPKVQLYYDFDGNSFTMKAQITLSGGGITSYGFAYSINGVKTLYKWFDEEIGKYQEFSHTISVDPMDEVWYQVIVKNEYGKVTQVDNIFYVPAEEPKIELETPDITYPDSYDDIVAGEDVEFEWDEIDDAEEYEWELYEADKTEGRKLTSGITTKEHVTIDGDWFEGNNVYSFYVRAVCGNSYSGWGNCTYLYCKFPDVFSVEEDDFQCGSEGGIGYIRLTSTKEWQATVTKTWIVINKSNGSGDAEIRVQVDPNYGDARTGSVIIHSELGDIPVTIHQHSGLKPYLTVSPDNIELSSEDGGWTFDIFSNVSWEISCDSDWIRNISDEEGYGDELIQILANENTSTESRTAKITITGGGFERTITVTQEGCPAVVGDINGDGKITNKDRFLLNRYVAGMPGYTNINKAVADINGDNSVDQTDADYLTYYLANIKGYETFPDPTTCLHTSYTPVYAGKTVFVSNTIKNDNVHSYYHMWYYVCNGCGEYLGEFQGNEKAEKGTIESNVPCTYNSDGVCSCGAIDTTGFTRFTISKFGKRTGVYDTPYSSDNTWGTIFADDTVVVLGKKASRYLVEYPITGGKKQGYVNASDIKSSSDYTISFTFDTVVLPATGRTVLLVPYKGYGTYTIKDAYGNTVNPLSLSGFNIESNSPKIQLTEDLYTIKGTEAGVSGLSAYYYDATGNQVMLNTPDFCAVVGTSQKSGEYSNKFLPSEVDAIKIGLDMFMSSNVPLPNLTDWTTWDGFLYYVEKFKDSIVGFFAGALTGTTGEQRESAVVIGEFIQWYIKEQNNEKVALSTDGSVWANVFSSLLEDFSNIKNAVDIHEFPSDVQKAYQTVLSLVDGVKDSKSFVEGLKAFDTLIDSDVLPLKVIQSALDNNGVSLDWFKGELLALIKLDILENPIDFAGLGLDAASTTFEVIAYVFADYSANLEVLHNIKDSLDASNVQDKILIGAIDILESEYTEKFKNSLGIVLEFAGELIVDGIIGMCPVAKVLLDAASTIIGVGTTVKEEADLILFQYFMYIFMGTIDFDDNVFINGKITDPYDAACRYSKLYFYMARYVNEMALKVNESKTIDKAVIQNNITVINNIIKRFNYYFN